VAKNYPNLEKGNKVDIVSGNLKGKKATYIADAPADGYGVFKVDNKEVILSLDDIKVKHESISINEEIDRLIETEMLNSQSEDKMFTIDYISGGGIHIRFDLNDKDKALPILKKYFDFKTESVDEGISNVDPEKLSKDIKQWFSNQQKNKKPFGPGELRMYLTDYLKKAGVKGDIVSLVNEIAFLDEDGYSANEIGRVTADWTRKSKKNESVLNVNQEIDKMIESEILNETK